MAEEIVSKRNMLFISHAAPEDNDFSRWLTLQLIGLGYEVWCDVLKLKGGEDFWVDIEKRIRENAVKFIFLLTKTSNQREGALKELSVAQKVKKQLKDDQFIIPIHVDPELSYDNVNIDLNRINSINFKKSWAEGLKNLLELLESQKIERSDNNFGKVNLLWQTIFMQNRSPVEQPEVYLSNWFPILEIPKLLRFHRIKYAIPNGYDLKNLHYPGVLYKDYLATFAWGYDFIGEFPDSSTYDLKDTKDIPVEEIFSGVLKNDFIRTREAKNLIIQLLNKGFDKSIGYKPVSVYQMSNHLSFWLKKGVVEKDKFNKVQLVGKQKEKNWHFGISGSVKMFPEQCFVINSHIWFTSDGNNLIQEDAKQHAARRKQGKNWWNNDWRSKTISFMQYLAENDGAIHLQMGSEEIVKISIKPMMFRSPLTYQDPNKANLPEEDFFYDSDIDDEMNGLQQNEIEL